MRTSKISHHPVECEVDLHVFDVSRGLSQMFTVLSGFARLRPPSPAFAPFSASARCEQRRESRRFVWLSPTSEAGLSSGFGTSLPSLEKSSLRQTRRGSDARLLGILHGYQLCGFQTNRIDVLAAEIVGSRLALILF